MGRKLGLEGLMLAQQVPVIRGLYFLEQKLALVSGVGVVVGRGGWRREEGHR